jgi:hypothetical protein
MLSVRQNRWSYFFAAAALFLLTSCTVFGAPQGDQPAPTIISDDPQRVSDKADLNEPVANLLKAHRFDDLEQLADGIRKANIHYADGKMKLEVFYAGLEMDRHYQWSDADYNQHMADVRTWVRDRPKSITANAALVSNLTGWAWNARGGGYADTVTNEQFLLFGSRLQEGAEAYEAAKKLPTQCPHLYSATQVVALGQHGWTDGGYADLFKEATTKFPTYYDYYLRKAYYLQPRWYGKQNDWVHFAEQAGDSTGGANGAKLFARIVWSVDGLGFYDNVFTEFSDLKWAKVKAGFEALQKEYPTNLAVESEFCKLAWKANDTKTAKALMSTLDNQCMITVWKKKENFSTARAQLTN